MTRAPAKLFLEQFDHLLATPEAVEELNRAILTLAVQGKLVAQDTKDEPASELLARIQAENAGKTESLPPVKESEKPFELPSEWAWAKIGSIISLEYGEGLTKTKRADEGKIPVYGSNGIVGYHTDFIVGKPCIVVGRKGSSGAVNLALEKSWVIDTAYYILPPMGLDIHFLFFMLKGLHLESLGKGIKPGLNRREAYELVVGVPPLAEQQRIVARVKALFAQTRQLADKLSRTQHELANLNQAALHHLLAAETPEDFAAQWDFIAAHFDGLFTEPEHIASLRQAVLELAVRGKLTRREATDEPAGELLKRIRAENAKLGKGEILPPVKESEKPFELPEGWEWVRFGDVASIASNLVQPDSFPTLPHIAPNNIEKGTGKILEYRTVAEDDVRSANHHFRAGQLLYSKIRPNLSKAIVVDFDGLCSADMYPVDVLIEPRYLLHFILSKVFLDMVTQKDTRVAMPKINQTELNKVIVAVPPLPEQQRMVAKVEQLLGLCDVLEAKLRAAREERVRLTAAVLAGVGGVAAYAGN